GPAAVGVELKRAVVIEVDGAATIERGRGRGPGQLIGIGLAVGAVDGVAVIDDRACQNIVGGIVLGDAATVEVIGDGRVIDNADRDAAAGDGVAARQGANAPDDDAEGLGDLVVD